MSPYVRRLIRHQSMTVSRAFRSASAVSTSTSLSLCLSGFYHGWFAAGFSVEAPECLFWAALSQACFWYSRCRLEQAWHRVSSGMGGAPHSTQMPRSLALSLLSWVLRRINSLRSGVWARWCSYSRRFSRLASSSARVGSTRGFGVLGWGVAFRDVFTAGLFQLWGCPPLLAGFGREKVNSKVWPIAHSCGVCKAELIEEALAAGSPPRVRGHLSISAYSRLDSPWQSSWIAC